MPPLKGSCLSQEHRQAISESLKGRLGGNHRLGTKVSLETANRISKALKGRRRPDLSGNNHGQWKGDEATYGAIHRWLNIHFGKANHCDINPNHQAKRYEWANISGHYSRNREDYIQVCPSCHRLMDFTEETREALRVSHLSLSLTAEQRSKISEGLKRAYAEGRR